MEEDDADGTAARNAIQSLARKVEQTYHRMELSENSAVVQEYRKSLGFIKGALSSYVDAERVEQLMPSSDGEGCRAVASINRTAWVQDTCEEGSVVCNRAIIAIMQMTQAHCAACEGGEAISDVAAFVNDLIGSPPKPVEETANFCRWQALVYRYYDKAKEGRKAGMVPRYPESLNITDADRKRVMLAVRMLDRHNLIRAEHDFR
ncbi:hypothetical protein JKP88DRAFT_315684 [Tribonema minus]|uniref:Uncharacterized protein n=1 Tax=Tribonema minus TaxID=303371 RepID=A0A835YYQ1_9STRA|nr:hypothetical protein JKP88DRAFT_315684 [Tribonema minus]